MINVLIVDDSATVRELLSAIISKEPGMRVAGTASDGNEAVRKASELQPDIITMDVNMPKKDGLEATKEIMRTSARPIVILSQYRQSNNSDDVFEALEAGALSVINKPSWPKKESTEKEIKSLLRSIRVLSEIKVITRKSFPGKDIKVESGPSTVAYKSHQPSGDPGIVAIGASTGGPAVIRQILSEIPVPFPLPIVIVQHISKGFLQGLVDWIGQATGHDVRIAQHGVTLEAGVVYFAPDERQMGVRYGQSLSILDTPPDKGLKPSVSNLFRSLMVDNAKHTIAILLSGMGTDGAEELLQLKEKGAATIIQNKESCIVFGMPGEAYRLGASKLLLAPPKISQYLSKIAADKFK